MAPLGSRPERQVGYSVWLWPPMTGTGSPGARPAVPTRIGDVERDEAVAGLGDHFAAGRLTREEFDERVDRAMQARFGKDLEPLFADLPAMPTPGSSEKARRTEQFRPAMLLAPLLWLVPLLVVGLVIAAFALNAPWPLWGLVWMLVIIRFSGRRRYSRGPWQRR